MQDKIEDGDYAFNVDESESVVEFPEDFSDQNWKGIAFVVYNRYSSGQKPLPDTLKDGRKMSKFFKGVKYFVVPGHNLQYREFMDTLKYLVKYPNFPQSCRRIVVYFAGHGTNESIVMEDGQSVKIKDVQTLLREFRSDKKVAKIFLIDACRFPGVKFRDLWYCFWNYLRCMIFSQQNNETKSANDSNELLAYATTENHAAFSLNYGGFWSQTLIKKLEEQKHNHVKEILRQMYNEMSSKEVPGFKGYYQHPISHENLEDDIYFWKEAGMLLCHISITTSCMPFYDPDVLCMLLSY